MHQPVQVAIIGPPGDPLTEQLSQLPDAPEVCLFVDLVSAAKHLRDSQPAALILSAQDLTPTAIGTLMILSRWHPSLRLIVTHAASDAPRVPDAMALDVELLPLPSDTETVAATVLNREPSTPLPHDEPPQFETLLRGIADEINNPILFADGHLQLLEVDLDDDSPSRRHVAAARDGLARVARAIDQIDSLRRIDPKTDGPVSRVDWAKTFEIVRERLGAPPELDVEVTHDQIDVHGDPETIAEIQEQIAGVAIALVRAGLAVRVELNGDQDDAWIRLVLPTPRPERWSPDRAFAPYHLSRIAPGTTQGLGLYLAGAMARARGGQARAFDGVVEVRLPKATP